MEKFSRSKSTRDNPGGVYPSMRDLRSFSTSGYNPNQSRDFVSDNFKDMKTKNGNNNNSNNKSKIASCSTKNWNFNVDPELQRKKRVASYKAYSVEGKMKSSFRKSFRKM
ncbi:hypothetical protein STAS_29810 [Striga asiatica]|uniref:Uncharacterized protein n=1 Tax=Striga asiatica TaxID=4170 RepID=A0A5A7R6L0_STRAF|nr:hypothetical protein STAS_29810 [Striga asiatica]